VRIIDRNLDLIRRAGLIPTVVRAPTGDDPIGVLSFPAPDRFYAVFSDERDPHYARVTTGMGFGNHEAPDLAVLLHHANDLNRAFRFVRTVVDSPVRVEFVFDAVLENPDSIARVLEAAVPQLARVADDFFDRLYLPKGVLS